MATPYRNTLAEVVENAAWALMIPGAWTQDAAARDKHNQVVTFDDPKACKWCAIGAIESTADHMKLPVAARCDIWCACDHLDEFNDSSLYHGAVIAEMLRIAKVLRYAE